MCDAFISLLSKYYHKEKLPKPDCVLQESRERSGAGECGETWIQDRYELFGGDLKSFLNEQDTFDWVKLDTLNSAEKPYYLIFEHMYQTYLQNGNVDSKINSGKMLKKLGCIQGRKKIMENTVVYVGIRSSYKHELEMVNDDDDSD